MKIGYTNGSLPLNPGINDKLAMPKPVNPKTLVDTPTITLSSLATQLHALEAKLADHTPFDAAKVEAIQQAIRSGQFKINPEVIADKLIASVREMVGK